MSLKNLFQTKLFNGNALGIHYFFNFSVFIISFFFLFIAFFALSPVFAEASLPNTTNFNISYGSTNFSAEVDIENVTGLALANQYGKIKFPNETFINASGEDYDSRAIISNHFISVNSSGLQQGFNTTANLTLSNITCPVRLYYSDSFYTNASGIMLENNACNSTTNATCQNLICSSSSITFLVSHFSSYAALALPMIGIWDENDKSAANANLNRTPNMSIRFFANYSQPNGSVITEANCSIWFNDTGLLQEMSYNNSNLSGFYEYQRNFSAFGFYSWNVSCNKSEFDNLTAARIFVMDNTSPIVTLATPLNATNITANNTVVMNVTATDDIGLSNCTFWSNYVLGWAPQETVAYSGTNITNSSTVTVLRNKTVVWNAYCCDANNNCAWAAADWIFYINYIPPFCGDQICNGGEDCVSCWPDCGQCGNGGSGGGGYSPTTVIVLSTKGDIETIRVNGKLSFVNKGIAHTLKVMSIKDDEVVINIESLPSTYVLSKGETQRDDLDNNGYDDIEVTLLDIIGDSKAKFQIMKLEEPKKGPGINFTSRVVYPKNTKPAEQKNETPLQQEELLSEKIYGDKNDSTEEIQARVEQPSSKQASILFYIFWGIFILSFGIMLFAMNIGALNRALFFRKPELQQAEPEQHEQTDGTLGAENIYAAKPEKIILKKQPAQEKAKKKRKKPYLQKIKGKNLASLQKELERLDKEMKSI